jgi:6-phosphofructokinase 2
VDDKNVETVVVSLGSGGAVLTTPGEQLEIRAPTVKIRSKVGAGDSMVAGIVLALSRGRPIEEAVRFGVAAGAAAVMTDGTDLCRRSDTERLFQEMQSSTSSGERDRK